MVYRKSFGSVLWYVLLTLCTVKSQAPEQGNSTTPEPSQGSCSGAFLDSCPWSNCILVNKVAKCTGCKDGYFISTDNTCLSCSANCSKCSALSGTNYSTCHECQPSCVLTNNVCDCSVKKETKTPSQSEPAAKSTTTNQAQTQSAQSQGVWIAVGSGLAGILILGIGYIVWRKISAKNLGELTHIRPHEPATKGQINLEAATTARSNLAATMPDIQISAIPPTPNSNQDYSPDSLVRQSASFVTSSESPKQKWSTMLRPPGGLRDHIAQMGPKRLVKGISRTSNTKTA